jgi:putative two-component system response regulator
VEAMPEGSSRSSASSEENGARILVVDDEARVRRMFCRILRAAGHQCVETDGGYSARRILELQPFELVVTDLDMPDGSGTELIQAIATDHPFTAAIMVTGHGNVLTGTAVVELGAYAYLTKPVGRDDMLVAVANALRRRRIELENRSQTQRLRQAVKSRSENLWEVAAELERTQGSVRVSHGETIARLSIACEYRNAETGEHIERMSEYCALLAEELGLDCNAIDSLRQAAAMHDVGKMGIPDNILLKRGKLSSEEFELMKQHTLIGHRILSGTASPLLDLAAVIALVHHERYDGKGYPRGIAGDAIPMEGRIAAIADVFDALTSDRVYRRAYAWPEAVCMMRQECGRHFDPEMLDLFLDNLDKALAIKECERRDPTTSGTIRR